MIKTCEMRIPVMVDGEWTAGGECRLPAPWTVTGSDGTTYHFCDDCVEWGC